MSSQSFKLNPNKNVHVYFKSFLFYLDVVDHIKGAKINGHVLSWFQGGVDFLPSLKMDLILLTVTHRQTEMI